MALKHPEQMNPKELDSYIKSLTKDELELVMETYGHRWRAYNDGFPRCQDEQAFIRTGQAIQSNYVNRLGIRF